MPEPRAVVQRIGAKSTRSLKRLQNAMIEAMPRVPEYAREG